MALFDTNTTNSSECVSVGFMVELVYLTTKSLPKRTNLVQGDYL